MYLSIRFRIRLISFGCEALSLFTKREQNNLYKFNIQIIEDAIKQNAKAFKYLYFYIKKHIHNFCILNPDIVRYLPISYHNNNKFIMDKIKTQPQLITLTSDECAIEILLKVYKTNTKLFKELIPYVISKEIIMRLNLFEKYPEIFDILTLELKTDIDILKIVFQYRVDVYMLLPEIIRYEKTNILLAVERDPMIYSSLPFEYRYDRDITLCAVSRKGQLLKFTSPNLKEDDEVVYAALRRHPDIINSLSLKYRLNIDTLIYASSRHARIILLPELNLNKEQIIRLLETRNTYLFKKIPKKFLDDRDIAKILLTYPIPIDLWFQYIDIFKTDRELLQIFLINNVQDEYIEQFINLRYETDEEKLLLRNYSCITYT
jgi:hypothetical protein